MIYEIDLLNDDQIYYVNKLFDHLEFSDGSVSNFNATARGKKKVLQSYDGQMSAQLNEYIGTILHQRVGEDFLLVRTSQIYFNKYRLGDHYDWHYDVVPIAGVLPHYSMTCFLNDDYEGGELEIKIGDSVVSYKLPAGKAVIYPTAFEHRVKEIDSGSRHVFTCWLESAIKPVFLRDQYVQLSMLIRNRIGYNPSSPIGDEEHLIDVLQVLRANIMRECA